MFFCGWMFLIWNELLRLSLKLLKLVLKCVMLFRLLLMCWLFWCV